MTGESDLWPRPLLAAAADDPMAAAAPDAPTGAEDVPALEHDQAELRAVERVLAILVRDASRGTRRQILALLDDMEAHR